jgi:hypothetical protein
MQGLRVRSGLLAVAAGVALLAGGLLAAPVGAAPGDPPESGDPRATAFAGNATTCADANLPGEIITVGFTIDATNRFVTITSVPDGLTLTGVVVKGGPAYNVYVGDVRTALHAPLGPNGQPAGISHWFACGITATSSPTPTPTPTTTPTTTPPPTSPSVQPAAPPPPAAGLAETGQPLGVLAALGLVLIATGAIMLTLPVLRRRLLGPS